MIRTVAVQGYRFLRDFCLPLGQLNVITGANGSGKSSVYRSLRLLADAALNSVVSSLAREGGLPSTFWAGPETIARGVRQGTYAVELLKNRKVASLKLGFGSDTYGYSIDLGYPPPPPPATLFGLDPHVKRECIWHGPVYRKASALVDRRNNFVWLATTRDEEPVMLTQHLSDTDSSSPVSPIRSGLRRCWPFAKPFVAGAFTTVSDRFELASAGRADRHFYACTSPYGSNLAAALQTILEIRSDDALATTLEDAFPGSRLSVEVQNGRFELQLQQHGLLRPLSAAELSDGTLRYLLWTASLLTPRPPEMMVLNEPETSLHRTCCQRFPG
jgi:predicted ATPase